MTKPKIDVSRRDFLKKSAALGVGAVVGSSMYRNAFAVREGGPDVMPASLPVSYIVARLRRRGIRAFASRDAGGYLCNATLYASLERARSVPSRRVGFIHIPASLAKPGGARWASACPLSWAQAMEGGLEILAACLHRFAARQAR